MPYCPECEYKYAQHVEQCPVCATPLVETLDEVAPYICDECKEPVTKSAQSCANCGTVFVEGLRCFLHPEEPSQGICVACGQHLCPQCSERSSRRYFCDQDSREEMQPKGKKGEEERPLPDWEAVLYQRHLKRDGVESRMFIEEKDRHLIYDADHLEDIKLIALFADKKQVIGTLMDREIEEEVVLFQCERCSAISRTNNPVCPNCRR